jgi:hypothetical protein
MPIADGTPQVNAPTPLAGGYPGVVSLFPGSKGTLYEITSGGALVRQPVLVSSDSSPAQLGPATVVEATGWGDALGVFENGEGWLFDVTPNGFLRSQNLTTGAPSSLRWTYLSPGWSRYHQVFGGAKGIYAVDAEGKVEHRLFHLDINGNPVFAQRRASPQIASGLFPWSGLASNVEGYAWPLSASPGESVSIKVGVRVSTPPLGAPATGSDPVTYSADVRRLRRWQNGKEGVFDEVKSALGGATRQACRYDIPADWVTRGAGWEEAFTVTVPDLPPDDPRAWPSGVYSARLTDASNNAFYVSFVVRPRAPRNPFAVLANTNTWNAYNSWGGQGKYAHIYPLPSTLPFQRPSPNLTPDIFWQSPAKTFTVGSSILTNSCHLLRAELWVLGWLEDLGPRYAYDLYTDQDLHDGNTGIGDGTEPRYQALILNTHPEYWTRQMYDRVAAYRDQGGSIIYLGGNGIYEEVVLSEDRQHMRIFNGVDLSRYPPYANNEQVRLNCLMRSPAVGRPEHALIGVGFQHCAQANPEGQPYQLLQDPADPSANPVLAGLTIGLKATLGATSNDVTPPEPGAPSQTYQADGWEVDQRGAGSPPQAYANEALLAMGPDSDFSGEMLCYRTDQGGLVFAAASLNFGGSLVVDANLQRIVQNALDLCLQR